MLGKEYLDFILDFLQGRKESETPKEKKYCYHELTKEEADKLEVNLQDKDLVYYFNVKEGLKTLVGSLEFNLNGLGVLQGVLEKE